MKFNKFLDDIDYKLMYEVGINRLTLQKIITDLYNCLSPTEKIKYQTKIDKILSYINSQIRIDDFVKKDKLNKLESELNVLNGKTLK